MTQASTIRSEKLNSIVAFFCLMGGAAALAYGGVFVRESELPPTASAVYRVLLAAPIFFLLAKYHSSSDARQVDNDLIKKFIGVGCIFAGNLSLYHWSINYTTLANSNLLANLAPIFVVIYMRFILGIHFTKGFLFAIGVTIAGALVLLGARVNGDDAYTLGNLFGIASGAFYGFYLFYLGRIRALADTNIIMAWSCIGTLIVLLPLTYLLGEPLVPDTVNGWITLGLLALVSHVAGQGLIAYALAHLSTAVSSLTLVLQVVFSTLFGWALVGELPLALEFIGGVVIIMGVLAGRRFAS